MPLVNAKCTNCGANLQVDNTKDAAICQHCGSAYIVEKAINNYRNERRDFELSRIESSGEGYFEAVFYLNILDALEKMGDFLINISQALQGVSRKAE